MNLFAGRTTSQGSYIVCGAPFGKTSNYVDSFLQKINIPRRWEMQLIDLDQRSARSIENNLQQAHPKIYESRKII
jgi:5-bromo-4-chloroindolyl phosphate hydrolysis protein